MSRPSDFIDSHKSAGFSTEEDSAPANPKQLKLGFIEWLRWGWRQLTSMKTALLLLLLLAVAAVPGSIFPQRSANPNGVLLYFNENPDLAPILDGFQFFDVYASVWFSSIYLLLFISLIGCVLPRIKHHWIALKSAPPKTPSRLTRTFGYQISSLNPAETTLGEVLNSGKKLLANKHYRIRAIDESDLVGQDLEKNSDFSNEITKGSISAERGYWRETGNLIFHSALVGVLVTVAIGSTTGYYGQRLLVEGQTFANTLSAYDSFTPGQFFSEKSLKPYAVTLDKFTVTYDTNDPYAYGAARNYQAHVRSRYIGQEPVTGQIRVNHPLNIGDTDIYLLGNGYAPTITVRNPAGEIVFRDSVPFLPQDTRLTSVGVVKIPDGLIEQVGMRGFFYPTVAELHTGAYTSTFPDLNSPLLTLNVYQGDLGIDQGIPRSVYTLDTADMVEIAGGDSGVGALELKLGETVELPNGLGSVTLDAIPRFASFDIHHDPSQAWVLVFALLALSGLFTSLFIPRRRIWIRATEKDGKLTVEYGGLSRSEDPNLAEAVIEIVEEHNKLLKITKIA